MPDSYIRQVELFELATTKTSALNPKVKALTLAAAGVSLS